MKVAVLMSTYNGEKYLSAQLDSIINQTYDDYELFVRDDGSSDRTMSILEQYEKNCAKLHVIRDDRGNLGYPACFYALTDMDIPADWFFFADQDDVWLQNKLLLAMNSLEKYDSNSIVAYYARYYICDDKLNTMSVSPEFPLQTITLEKTLFEVPGLEFTMAISSAAKQYLNLHKPVVSKARGTWMAMLYAAKGEIVFGNEPCAKYRRHGSAVTNSNTGMFGLQLWRIKKFLLRNGFSDYKLMLKEFKQIMRDELSMEERHMLDVFTYNKRLPKFFYRNRLRTTYRDEVALRLIFLMGKL